MKKLGRKILTVVTVFLMGVGMVAPALNAVPVYATNPATTVGAQAAILTGCAGVEEKEGNGAGVKCIVRLVVDILSVLIGIVGVIGIVVVGIQYMTAGGNEEQTRKAKRRLFEIVIGLVAYAVAYALLAWLLPGFSPTTNSTSSIIYIEDVASFGVIVGA